jgi:hypothetical protein
MLSETTRGGFSEQQVPGGRLRMGKVRAVFSALQPDYRPRRIGALYLALGAVQHYLLAFGHE